MAEQEEKSGSRKRVLTIAGVISGVLLLVLLMGAIFASCRLESIVQGGIEQRGSEIVGTPVKLDSVELSLLSGKGALNNLSVANPEGYGSASVVEFTKAEITVDPWSVLDSDGPIVIQELVVKEAVITFEGGLSKNNIGAIRKNINTGRSQRDSDEPQRRIILERFLLEDAQVQLDFRGGIASAKRTVAIPDMELRDLGVRPHGALPRQVTIQVLSAVGQKVREAVARTPGPWQKLRNTLQKHLGGQGKVGWHKLGKTLWQLGRQGAKAVQEEPVAVDETPPME